MTPFSRFCPSDPLLLLTVNVLAQIAVVVVLAGAISLLFARHRAALRHAIWLSALLCVVLSPAAAYLAAEAGRPLISLRVLPRSATSEENGLPSPFGRGAGGEGRDVKQPTETASSFETRRPNPRPKGESANPLPSPFWRGAGSEGRNITKQSVASATATPGRDLSPEAPPPPRHAAPPQSGLASAWLGLVAAVWIIGASVLFLRLIHGCWQIARLRRRLRPIDESRLGILVEARRVLNRDKLPPLAMLPRAMPLNGPITIGLFRSCVVVPEEILARVDPRDLRDVLVHEFAHALRRDPLVGFVQRLAAIVYWPYPPVHFLNRRLAVAREEVCDNYVLREGDAPRYAETLLAISQTVFSKRMHPAALGLFHPCGKLERRVAGLLDSRRSVMVRTHRAVAAFLAVLFITTAVVVAGTRLLRAEPPPAKTAPSPAGEAQPAIKAAPTVEPATPAASRSADAPSSVIVPGDVLAIYATGPLPDHAIDSVYPVRPDGKVDLKPPYGEVDVNRLSMEQAEKRIAEHLKTIMGGDNIEVRYALAAAAVAKIEYQEAEEVNRKVPGTVTALEVRRRLLEWHKAELAVEKARRDTNPSVRIWRTTKAAGPADMLPALPTLPPPTPPYRIGVWDVLQVQVVGTLPDQPIDGFFLVEDTGTLALGPSYGRVVVKGLTVEEAEKAITHRLQRTLRQPQVQVILAKSVGKNLAGLETAASRPTAVRGSPPPEANIGPPPSYQRPEPAIPSAAFGRPGDTSFDIIQPLDVLQIRAIGTLVDQRIDGFFLVYPDGQVALGPAYGRVKIGGLTWEQAEKEITRHLKTILVKPEVQVALSRRGPSPERALMPQFPYKIRVWDIIWVNATGTLADQPIDDLYLVEPGGLVALGPQYGRAKIDGLTCEQAESAITKQLEKVLQKPKVQVTPAERGEPWREAILPKLPYKVGAWDVLQVRAINMLVTQPIDGYFLVESTGTLAFGPAYGRMKVQGLSLYEAEAAIQKKLKQVVTKPEVQVTLAKQAGQTAQWRATPPPQPPYAIYPGMPLWINVAGALLDQPIDAVYSVEATGAVALGPAYGRVQVGGMTLEAAQEAIQKKLREVLSKPEVQVSFAGWQQENDQLLSSIAARKARQWEDRAPIRQLPRKSNAGAHSK